MRVLLIKIGGGTNLPALGVHTIKEALNRRGINDVHILHQNDHSFTAGLRRAANLPDKELVFLLSTTSEEYFNCRLLGDLLRESYPDSLIGAGGAAFWPEKIEGVQSIIETALKETTRAGKRIFDIVNAGDAEPTVKLLEAYHGNYQTTNLPGLYYVAPDGNLAGEGAGAYPIKDHIPYLLDEKTGKGIIYTDRRCPNNCGFCCLNKGGLGFSKELILKTLREIIEKTRDKNNPVLAFVDSNPLALRRPTLLDLFESLAPEGKPTLLKKIYLDPTLLTTPDSFSLVQRLVLQGFIGFYLGRDTVSARTAAMIGSNIKGMPKTQKQLDAEGRAIRHLIATLEEHRQRDPYPPLPFEIGISYIFTPFDTKKTFLTTFGEIESLERSATENVHINLNLNVLAPYPGTDVRSAYVDLMKDPAAPHLVSTYQNAWRDDAGPAARILGQIGSSAFPEDKRFFLGRYGPTLFYQQIRRNIADIFGGDQQRCLISF